MPGIGSTFRSGPYYISHPFINFSARYRLSWMMDSIKQDTAELWQELMRPFPSLPSEYPFLEMSPHGPAQWTIQHDQRPIFYFVMTLSSLFDSTMISSRVLHRPVERYLSIVLVLIPSGFTAFAHEQGYRYNIPAGVNIASGLQVGRGHRLH